VDSRVLRRQVDGLRDQFRLLTFDARGSGHSDRPSTGYSFDDHLEDALAVLDATGTTTASAVAASTGTHVAVLLAVCHPDRVGRLVLVAPPMDVPTDDQTASHASADGADEEPDWRTAYPAFVRWFIEAVFPEPGMDQTIAEIVEIALEADHAMLVQQSEEMDWDDAPRRLPEVDRPALVIHGTADSTLGLESVKTVAAAIPGAELALLDGLGHRPDISRPDVVNPLLTDFLGRRPAPPSSSPG
jgi:3-oxoadipate enol-lactonase